MNYKKNTTRKNGMTKIYVKVSKHQVLKLYLNGHTEMQFLVKVTTYGKLRLTSELQRSTFIVGKLSNLTLSIMVRH